MKDLINKSISVVLPAYNEEEVISAAVIEINDYLKNRFKDYEILVVSEGSTDSTNKIVTELQENIDHLRLITKEKSYGYAGALRSGFRNCIKELIFYTDADKQFDINGLDNLLTLIDKHEIVTGFKIKRSDSWVRIWMSWLYNFAMKLIFGLRLKDINCAFKLYKREVIKSVDFLPDVTEGVINVEIYLSALKNGYTIGEVGVNHFPRLTGLAISEFNVLGNFMALVRPRVIIGFIKDTIKLWKKIHHYAR